MTERVVVPRRKRVSQQRMLDAACAEFARVGYRGASVERIAEAAGTTKATVYTRFGPKEGLFAAALGREADDLRSRLIAAYAADPKLPLRERLHLYVHAYFTFAQERPDGFKLLFLDESEGSSLRSELVEEISGRIAELVSRQLGARRPNARHRLLAALIVGATHNGAGEMAAHGVPVAQAADQTEVFLAAALGL
jgi:AcrR family transcriptional regulator